jgi:hypothetical protein
MKYLKYVTAIGVVVTMPVWIVSKNLACERHMKRGKSRNKISVFKLCCFKCYFIRGYSVDFELEHFGMKLI